MYKDMNESGRSKSYISRSDSRNNNNYCDQEKGMEMKKMEENGFPCREYSLKRGVLEAPGSHHLQLPVHLTPSHHHRVVSSSPLPLPSTVTRGHSLYPGFYLVLKHFLLAILFLMLIWTLLKIPLAEKYMREKIPDDMSEKQVTFIRTIVTVARVLIVILVLFGIVGVIKESFSLILVFSVFMFVRLIITFYIPYFNNGGVSIAIISFVTLTSFIFLALVSKVKHTYDADSHVCNDNDSIDI